ncbi:uncharacterized protein LOC128677947 isoform X2 [Plodia interpunctella]|uniref:uncharacterized protein LOC128677947 isoform X2 n=1 Tax=Plodia interpunctella TaxID=58824 RepID=UPI00236766DD|nr:uncharacterized protein LOC128677947 isoform X2 [Plodia interpunctella]
MAKFRIEPSWQREVNVNKNHASGDPLATLKLKQYAAKIRQSLVGAVTANSSIKYTVHFEEQPLLKYSTEDSNGLMITVSSAQETSTKSKVAYTAILLSWGVSCTLNGATHLPYLLEKGEQRVGTAVKSTLRSIFDCNIQPFIFTQHQLLQFGFNFVENDTSRSSDPFTLSYKTPQVEQKDKLNLTFDVGDVHIIWNGIREESAKRSELVNLAYQILQNQIFYMIMLDVTVFDLSGITLPKAEVKTSGIVKMKTPEVVNSVFMVLNEINNNKDVNREVSNVST